MDTTPIGRKFAPKRIVVEEGQLRLFAKATGAKDEVHCDAEAARAAGYPGLLAPPTFLWCLDTLAPTQDPNIAEFLGIDVARTLHGEQRFKYGKPVHAGDVISFESEITEMYEKKGGALQFVVTETRATNQNAELVGTMVFTMVIR